MPADPLNDALATLAELRTFDPLDDEAKYPDDLVLEVRDAVVDALEHACSAAFVRRAFTDDFDDSVPMSRVTLERTRKPVVTAVAVQGVELDATGLAQVRVGKGGLVRREYGAFGRYASITYVAGWEVPPPRVARAVKLLTRDWLVENIDDALPSRATSMTAGDSTFRLVTAGVAGAIFDLPEANVIAKRYAE